MTTSRTGLLSRLSALLGVTALVFFIVFFFAVNSASRHDGGCGGGQLSAPFDVPMFVLLLATGAALAAVITGVLARRKGQKGAGPVTGIVLGALPFSLAALTVIFIVLFPARCGPNVPREILSLHTICTSETTYALNFGGYSETLAQLGGDGFPTLDKELVSGKDGDYTFRYVPLGNLAIQGAQSYAVYADPVNDKDAHYFTDPTGVIRKTSEARSANAHDPTVDESQESGYRIGDLEEINRCEKSYASRHGGTFSKDLEPFRATPKKANLIEPVLASGVKYQYKFKYVGRKNPKTQKIESYEVYADPLESGLPHYFADQTEVIRKTIEPRQANLKDPPLPD